MRVLIYVSMLLGAACGGVEPEPQVQPTQVIAPLEDATKVRIIEGYSAEIGTVLKPQRKREP